MQQIIKPELLAPAGSMQSLYAAVNNGCDAIYLGGKDFSARQYAQNFDIDEMEKAVDYCHLRGVKLYATVNTLYKDKELIKLVEYIKNLYEIGVDAIILQDLGAARLIRKSFGDLPLHASTQMTVNTADDVNFLSDNGFSTVVLSRELSLEEISRIRANSQASLEVFIHGALCVSYSGQCIMSSMLGGRSGNRGRCAQTCRLPYGLYDQEENVKNGHLLCPKDIQTITVLPQLIEAGINVFKIEGRMKSPEYVAGVTGIYRKYIDQYCNDPLNYEVSKEDMRILMQLFNRGGFTEGYFNNHSGSSMMSVERPKPWGVKIGIVDSYDERSGRCFIRTRQPLNPGDGIEIWTSEEPHVGSNINKASRAGEVINILIKGKIKKNDVVYKTNDKVLMDDMNRSFKKDSRKKTIFGRIDAVVGSEAMLTLWENDGSLICAKGAEVQKAENQAMDEQKLTQQLSKMGSTPFELEKLDVNADKDIYISIKDLNELRREACQRLETGILKRTKRKSPEFLKFPEISLTGVKMHKRLNVSVRKADQLEACLEEEGIDTIYVSMELFSNADINNIVERARKNNIKIYAQFPRIFRGYTEAIYSKIISRLIKSDIDGFLISSPGEIELIKDSKKPFRVDYCQNAFNNEAVQFWTDLGAEMVAISPELNVTEINEAATDKCEMLAHGYLPLMTTQQCPIGNFVGNKEGKMYCEKRNCSENYVLKDRKGVSFLLMPDCTQCVCTILNSRPLFTLKFFGEILRTPTSHIRIAFSVEDKEECSEVINCYLDMLNDFKNPSIAANALLENMAVKGSTKGHYFRGVE